ncbi:MAG: transcription initiation factor IIB [Promethearchaeota archaeon]
MERASKINDDFHKCPECGGNIISRSETGDIVCSQCGLIIQEKTPDYAHAGRRAFNAQERRDRERTGSPISSFVPDMGLTTVIDRKDIRNPDLKRAAKWNTRMNWEKRNLLIATTELKRIASNLNLPDHVKEEALRIYKEAFRKKLLRGRSINGMVAACLYYAAKIKRFPVTFDEIISQTNVSDRNVRVCYSAIIRDLKLRPPTTDPASLIPKYISLLGLDNEIAKLANQLIKSFKEKVRISGKDPKGICAGAIYLACKLRRIERTQREIAKVIGVTEVTLRSRFKELMKILNIII